MYSRALGQQEQKSGEPQKQQIQQETDSEAEEKTPADPLYRRDPLERLFRPVNRGLKEVQDASKIKIGATYTFLSQYATVAPDSPRHGQYSGRFDFNLTWAAYRGENGSGSLNVLIRSGTNIGQSQQFDLSDQLGSLLITNCLQGTGAQRPVTVNMLYWRQQLFANRLALSVGKIHPNSFIGLSPVNDDETKQFLGGPYDGNISNPFSGAWTPGAAAEYSVTEHVFLHAVVADTQGTAQSNLKTLLDRKFYEAVELGWRTGVLGRQVQIYRAAIWRDDTKTQGSGHGGGIGFDHEFKNGWTPFGRIAFGTRTGMNIKQTTGIGLTHIRPFGRRGDMFGAGVTFSRPGGSPYRRHENLYETFYRVRMTQSMELGPDLQVLVHPSDQPKIGTTVLLGARMRILF